MADDCFGPDSGGSATRPIVAGANQNADWVVAETTCGAGDGSRILTLLNSMVANLRNVCRGAEGTGLIEGDPCDTALIDAIRKLSGGLTPDDVVKENGFIVALNIDDDECPFAPPGACYGYLQAIQAPPGQSDLPPGSTAQDMIDFVQGQSTALANNDFRFTSINAPFGPWVGGSDVPSAGSAISAGDVVIYNLKTGAFIANQNFPAGTLFNYATAYLG